MNNTVELVKEINGEAYTTSRLIAEKFGKEHKNVIRDIEKLRVSDLSCELFIETTYKNRGREYKEYLVSQDGLTLYLFNIQGFVEEKMEYINEFNRMKQLITDLQLGKPEAIMGLLTWKNANMENTIRKYINGGNVLRVLPAIAEECKKQILDGETKLEVLTTAIRTVKKLRDEEENLAYKDLYNQAIEKASSVRDKILISRMGGLSTSKNRLADKCERLEERNYNEEDFISFLDKMADDNEYIVYSNMMNRYVGYIADKTCFNHNKVYRNIYSNVASRYNNVPVPTAKEVKEAGFRTIAEYYFLKFSMKLLDEFAAEAYNWASNLGYNADVE